MSQWSNYQGHPSIYENDGNARSVAPTAHSRHASNTSAHPSSTTTSPSAQRIGSELPSRGLELPPLVRTSVSPSIPRSVTLPSVLNPVPDERPTSNHRRRKADELDSPHESAPTLPPLAPTSQGPASLSGPGNTTPLPLLTEPVDRPARKMLTPKSPLRRAISLSHLNPPSGNMDAHQNPFPASPRSRPYAVEPGMAGAPPLPTPPAGGYSYPSLLQTNHLARTASPDSGSAQRYSASPSPDYSAYDHTSPTSDVPMPGYLAVTDAHRGGRGLSMPPVTSAPHVSDSYHIPMSSGPGQSSLQMMTLKTTEGDVRFPVDVQAASRVADEKRRRNAGASARFRERRKRKEMEATATIARLEQQVKDMTEDAEFYRQDRDMLASIMSQLPGGREHLPRPQSPRNRRTVSMPTSQGHYVELQRDSPEPIRNVRKRGDSPVPQAYIQAPMQSHAPPPPPPAQLMRTQHPLQAHPHHPQMSAHAVHASSLPPPTISHTTMPASSLPPPPPPSIMQAPPMTGPSNPFARHETGNRFHLPPHSR